MPKTTEPALDDLLEQLDDEAVMVLVHTMRLMRDAKSPSWRRRHLNQCIDWLNARKASAPVAQRS